MAKFRKKPVNGQEFKVVDPCCNGSLDFEGRTYKRLAGSKVANNVMEEETCRITHLCHSALIRKL